MYILVERVYSVCVGAVLLRDGAAGHRATMGTGGNRPQVYVYSCTMCTFRRGVYFASPRGALPNQKASGLSQNKDERPAHHLSRVPLPVHYGAWLARPDRHTGRGPRARELCPPGE